MDKGSDMDGIESRRLIRLPEVLWLTGLSRSTLYKMVSGGRFPRQVEMGDKARGWRLRDVVLWIESRPSADADSPQELGR